MFANVPIIYLFGLAWPSLFPPFSIPPVTCLRTAATTAAHSATQPLKAAWAGVGKARVGSVGREASQAEPQQWKSRGRWKRLEAYVEHPGH